MLCIRVYFCWKAKIAEKIVNVCAMVGDPIGSHSCHWQVWRTAPGPLVHHAVLCGMELLLLLQVESGLEPPRAFEQICSVPSRFILWAWGMFVGAGTRVCFFFAKRCFKAHGSNWTPPFCFEAKLSFSNERARTQQRPPSVVFKWPQFALGLYTVRGPRMRPIFFIANELRGPSLRPRWLPRGLDRQGLQGPLGVALKTRHEYLWRILLLVVTLCYTTLTNCILFDASDFYF